MKIGELYYTVKCDESALRLVADMQKKIDEYGRAMDAIILALVDYDSVSTEFSSDYRIGCVFSLLDQYKKELMKTKSGREFLSKHNIDMTAIYKQP